jgi:hypothetical protein
MKDAVKLAFGLVALYVVLTWSYSGYKTYNPDSFEESVADRMNKDQRVDASIAY